MENNRQTQGGLWLFFRNLFFKLFKKDSSESNLDSRKEGEWEKEYERIDRINFAEIFATRLTNYTLDGFSFDCDNDDITEAIDGLMGKSYKWAQMAFGVGRVFLVPYITGGKIYTDIIPQGRAWTTAMVGDDIYGIGVMADIRVKNNRRFYRLTSYEFDPETNTFTIENKATNESGAEVALNTFKEWAGIEPVITLKGVEKPLFAFVDCPKDNRTTDKLQGAPITFGCDDTIQEIRDTMKQYASEFDLKQSWLGVDKLMLGKDGKPDNHLFRTFDGKSTENLFEIFSPDIRDNSYRQRLLDLFSKLEKQVGTSNGILTPADTSMATATQVRRSMYDTLAMVGRMRNSIDKAIRALCYCYEVYFPFIGKATPKEYNLRLYWEDKMLQDTTERFQNLMQAKGFAVKDEEIRQLLFPNETAEERAAAVQEIRENQPEPTIPDFFGE